MAFKYLKDFMFHQFERVLVVTLLLALSLIMVFVPEKIGFLNFYYLPALVAGYAMGKKGGVLTAASSILIVIFSIVAFPKQYMDPTDSWMLKLTLNLLPWGGFLILSSYTIGCLCEQKAKQLDVIRDAYVGVLEILSKLIESVDRYTEGHSVRVSKLAMDIAIAMDMRRDEVENIRVAGLLHDIGKFDITTGLIQKAASLTEEERTQVNKHPEIGAQLVSMVGPVLQQAIPIILAHHHHYVIQPTDPAGNGRTQEIPLGARIVAVADAYDAIVTDRPYRKGRPPWQALEEIRKGAGSQFDPDVVDAFEKVGGNYISMET
jgi:putative nucleotidyltransferase with HDIG domain